MDDYIKKAFNDAQQTLQQFYGDFKNLAVMNNLSWLLADVFKQGNKILICGNGGSMTDAMHFAEEMTGRFRKNRPALPAIAISDPSHLTCVGNDYGFEEVFSRGVEAFGNKGDLLIALSTSGNSQNVINAVKKAKAMQIATVGLLGKDGGKLNEIVDHKLIVPGDTSDRIQEIHMMILHILIEMIERILFPRNY